MIFNTISGHKAKQQFSFVASHSLFPRVQRVWVYLTICSLITDYQCVSSSKRATNTSYFYRLQKSFSLIDSKGLPRLLKQLSRIAISFLTIQENFVKKILHANEFNFKNRVKDHAANKFFICVYNYA